jgi:endonuclease III
LTKANTKSPRMAESSRKTAKAEKSGKPAKSVKTVKPIKAVKPVKAGKLASKKVAVTTKTPKKVTKAVALEMMNALCKLYPDADCELDYKTPFQLLIATILSAQTTDVSVNKVTPKLFARFPDAKALAEADPDEVKQIIKATGFFNAKAKSIQSCAEALIQKFGGKVPGNQDDLITLPGVGRKTANVVLGVAFGVPGWTVDTHVQRLSQRLGFTTETDPYKIELDLQKLFPEQDWTKFSITLIWHGRRLCFARKPACEQCPINQSCPSSLAV